MNKKTKRSIPVYLQIIIGMIVGVIAGFFALRFDGGKFTDNWIVPWGRLFIRLLQLIAVPLVFVSLVKGVLHLKSIQRFSRMGLKTVSLYLVTTIVAVLLGVSMGSLVKPGNIVDKTEVIHLQESYLTAVEEKEKAAEQLQKEGPLSFLNDIVPSNFISAASDNTKMLQIIFFALFFALAALSVAQEKIEIVVRFFDSLNLIILRMVDYIIRLAPYGVAALMTGLVTSFGGSMSIFTALGAYALTVIAALFILLAVFYPLLVHFFTSIKVKHFFKSMYPVQLFAFTTSSSAASLPYNMETVEKKLGVSEESTSFVLPVGATINMDGTSCYQAIAVLFIAQVLNIDLSLAQLLIIVGMTVLSSIGTPAIPGGSYVILAMVLTSVGIPAEGLALIIGIDRPLDMLRTSVNVTGDAAVSLIVDKKSKVKAVG